MNKVLSGSLVALATLVISPSQSQAFWNSPQCSGGFGKLGACVYNCCPGIHFHGPLYNYGPHYNGPGYEYMRIGPPHCGNYVPAYPASYYGFANYSATGANWDTANPYARQQGPIGFAQPPAVNPSTCHQSFVPTPVINPASNAGYFGGVVPAYFTTSAWEVKQR